ncbi:T-complex protein 1 subunit theta-like 2 [Camelus dromedarius]|uniref:T-complex protein 1 subunit theta-like 2 n=1 Tax=Camelus dromedarius TaxID=9838 RepID=A0A5N4DYV3_CAMDR|nr:T-complex protein 1 subunit theta-like 2 [Camelus dromedarius]
MDSRASSAQALPERLGTPAAAAAKDLLSSVAAAHTLARVLRPCYGPHGRQKLLVTAKGETVFTGYATAILRALELEHPAARLLREAAQAQAEQSGDGAAFVVLLAQALLAQAERLLRAGLPRAQLRRPTRGAPNAGPLAFPGHPVPGAAGGPALGPLLGDEHARAAADRLPEQDGGACVLGDQGAGRRLPARARGGVRAARG